MKKIATVLCVLMLLPLFVFGAGAYGASDGRLIVTHINVDPAYYEGAGVIYTDSADGTLGAYGSFTWWYTLSFEWDADQGCYVVSEVHNTVNSDKSAVVIPQNGFCYCVNLGNDYPQLYKDDPIAFAAYADSSLFPDYTTDEVTDSFDFAATVKKGDRIYLYGTDLESKYVDVNEVIWYKEGFESKAFVSVNKEAEGDTPYSPDGGIEIKQEYKLGINGIDIPGGEGHCMMYTSNWGTDIQTSRNYSYDWWKTATFDWDEAQNAYVVTQLDLLVSSGRNKCTLIPKNGFVIAVNLGNGDYINDTANYVFEKLSALKVGQKAHLVGIDPKNSTFEYTGNIKEYFSDSFVTNGFVVISDTQPEGAYTPDSDKEKLGDITFTNDNDLFSQDDIEITWDAVENADRYLVYLLDTTSTPSGLKVDTVYTEEPQYTVNGSKISAGSTYTVRVTACSNDFLDSSISGFSFRVAGERALNSIFRDKKIIAFGDSITECVGGWVEMLFAEFGCDVINAGVGGDTTVHALNRIDSEVIEFDPDVVIVNFGMNDQAFEIDKNKNIVPIDEYEQNYRTIIQKLQDCGARVILVGVHDVHGGYYRHDHLDYNTGAIDEYVAVVKKLAEEYNTGFLDINALAQDQLAQMCAPADGVHLSPYGNKMYCKWIADYMYQHFEEVPFGTETSTETDGETSSFTSEDLNSQSTEGEQEDSGMPTWLLIVAIVVMFAGISVFGVLFIKTVKKNNKN